MEPAILCYIGTMSILGLFATNIVCKNCQKNINKKENIRKKKFKHYRFI